MKGNIDATIYYFLGCVILSAAIVIFFSRKATMYSYGTMSGALFIMMFLVYSFIRDKPIEHVSVGVILGIFEHGLPVILLFVVTSWLFFINIKYHERLTRDTISPDYRKYEYFSLGFLIAEIVLLLQMINTMITIAKKEASKAVVPSLEGDKTNVVKMRAGIYVMATFNMIFVAIMHSIISLFVTDG